MIYRFIHVPKNAGTSFINFLEKNSINFDLGTLKGTGNRVGTHRYAEYFLSRKHNQIFLAVKRNPYTRLISYYNYFQSEKFNITDTWTVSFEYFIMNKIVNPNANIPSPWILQSQWLLDSLGNIAIDQLFAFENLEKEMQNYFNTPVPLEKLNISRNATNAVYYTNNLKKIVYEHFKNDFKLLGYEK